jgi:hypothetical protein
MEYIDYDRIQCVVLMVMVKVDHVMKMNNIKNSMEVIHWKEEIVQLIMLDRFHDHIEMMVNDYHNNLIDYYFYYLFDLMMTIVDNHHWDDDDDDDNVSINHFEMKLVENLLNYVMNDSYNHCWENFLRNDDHYYVTEVYYH